VTSQQCHRLWLHPFNRLAGLLAKGSEEVIHE
jgi:hypothetical protein